MVTKELIKRLTLRSVIRDPADREHAGVRTSAPSVLYNLALNVGLNGSINVKIRWNVSECCRSIPYSIPVHRTGLWGQSIISNFDKSTVSTFHTNITTVFLTKSQVLFHARRLTGVLSTIPPIFTSSTIRHLPCTATYSAPLGTHISNVLEDMRISV